MCKWCNGKQVVQEFDSLFGILQVKPCPVCNQIVNNYEAQKDGDLLNDRQFLDAPGKSIEKMARYKKSNTKTISHENRLSTYDD